MSPDPDKAHERASAGSGSGWTLLLIPDSSKRPVLQLSLDRQRLRLIKTSAFISALLLLGLLAGVLFQWRQIIGYQFLNDENANLRAHLARIEEDLNDLDEAIRRVRLYDSQFRYLSESADLPGFGPIDVAGYQGLEPPSNEESTEDTAPPVPPAHDNLDSSDIRPAELWAQAIDARVSRLVGVVRDIEPRMNDLVQNLEGWRSLRASLPAIWPLDGVITSGFGYRRSPFTHRWKFHSGLDISAARGTPIVTPSPGVVTFSGYREGYGRMIEIDNSNGIGSRFAHNTTHYVKVGDVVEQGQVIATVGSTGYTTGPHLHYELLIDGKQVDPLDYLP